MSNESRDERPTPGSAPEASSQEEPRTLDYGTPSPPAASSILGSTIGLLLGLGGVGLGCAIPFMFFALSPNGIPIGVRVSAVAISVPVAASAFWGTIRFRRARPWSGRTAFAAGLVLGVGLASLLEGLCFGIAH